MTLFLVLTFLVAAFDVTSADLFYKTEKAIKLTDINPAADNSIPISVTGLNSSGSFVGYFPSSDANKLHAFVWNNVTKTFVDLHGLLAADSSLATCINDNGTIAGVFWELGTYAEKGFVYYPDGTISTFTGPGASQEPITAVTAINASNSIIGAYTAQNSTTRGYIIQHSTSGSIITDLGDIGDNGAYYIYLWPNALNSVNQVVGNVYLFSRRSHLATLTQGFFWDSGMTMTDASSLSDNWTAVSLNNSGQAVGLYDIPSQGNAPFSIVGSYVWDGSSANDMGNLGGNGNVNVLDFTARSV